VNEAAAVSRPMQAIIVAVLLAGCGGSPEGELVGNCTVYKPDAGGGGYAVGDAGVVEVYLERGQLVLVQIRDASGWESEVLQEEDGELEVAFSQGGERITFGAQVGDDVLDAYWCP
jgi:hypothetical protein